MQITSYLHTLYTDTKFVCFYLHIVQSDAQNDKYLDTLGTLLKLDNYCETIDILIYVFTNIYKLLK